MMHKNFHSQCNICYNVFYTDAILQVHKQDSHAPPPLRPPPAQQQQDQAGQPQGNIIIYIYIYIFLFIYDVFMSSFCTFQPT